MKWWDTYRDRRIAQLREQYPRDYDDSFFIWTFAYQRRIEQESSMLAIQETIRCIGLEEVRYLDDSRRKAFSLSDAGKRRAVRDKATVDAINAAWSRASFHAQYRPIYKRELPAD